MTLPVTNVMRPCAHLLIVHLQHLHLDVIPDLAPALVLQVEEVIESTIVDAAARAMLNISARHGVCLSRPCLAISKDTDVVAIYHRSDQRLSLQVHALLIAFAVEHFVESKNIPSIVLGIVECHLALVAKGHT
jgi:hypothetical protein